MIEPAPYSCMCCGYWTLTTEGSYEICPVCWWEDDPQARDDATVHSGPNHVSLDEARANFAAFGASTENRRARARPPTPEESRPL